MIEFSYFNPISNQHNALKDFKRLNLVGQLETCLITALATIMTLPFLGLGGVYVFRLMVNHSIKNLDSNANSLIFKITNRATHLLLKRTDYKYHISSEFISRNLKVSAQINQSFTEFVRELESEIFPFYESHEKSFDKGSIHGRMHVGRALIFGEVMTRYFQNKATQSIDFSYVRRVIGMHDAGRKGNGVDQWEKESSHLLCIYLQSKGISKEEALEKSRIIIKNECDSTSFEFKAFQSADCLDIMRECTGNGGRIGFNPKYFTFLKDSLPESEDFMFRQELIEEAWEFIKITEERKGEDNFKKNEGFMVSLFKIIENDPKKFRILSSIF